LVLSWISVTMLSIPRKAMRVAKSSDDNQKDAVRPDLRDGLIDQAGSYLPVISREDRGLKKLPSAGAPVPALLP
jgi:hypothetical protein